MDAKSYLLNLELILGSSAKIKLLKVLYKYQNIEQSISWLAKQAKISVNQAKLIIDTYKKLGLINYRCVANSILVNLKKDTISYEIISILIEKQNKIKNNLINDIKLQLKNIKVNVKSWIFGSFTKDTLKQDSDIDILLIFNNKKDIEKNKDKINIINEKISYKYQKKISFLILTNQEFNNDNNQLKNNILRDGEIIYG
jgi:predicted nucleotidyltransferase